MLRVLRCVFILVRSCLEGGVAWALENKGLGWVGATSGWVGCPHLGGWGAHIWVGGVPTSLTLRFPPGCFAQCECPVPTVIPIRGVLEAAVKEIDRTEALFSVDERLDLRHCTDGEATAEAYSAYKWLFTTRRWVNNNIRPTDLKPDSCWVRFHEYFCGKTLMWAKHLLVTSRSSLDSVRASEKHVHLGQGLIPGQITPFVTVHGGTGTERRETWRWRWGVQVSVGVGAGVSGYWRFQFWCFRFCLFPVPVRLQDSWAFCAFPEKVFGFSVITFWSLLSSGSGLSPVHFCGLCLLCDVLHGHSKTGSKGLSANVICSVSFVIYRKQCGLRT